MDKSSDLPRKDSTNEDIVNEIISKHFPKDTVEESPEKQPEDEELSVPEDVVHTSTTLQEEEPTSDTDDDDVEEVLSPNSLMLKKQEVQSLKDQGNTSFRNGNYEEALKHYRKALSLCKHKDLHKERGILYSNKAATELKMSHPKPAIDSASKAIKYYPEFPKGYLRRAKAYEIEDKLDECLEDYKKVLELDRQSKEALEAIPGLERRINERNEKMKEEMMAKLKDLGNLVLRPFGLSTNNFQMNQDPKTGGYSINFKQ